MPLDCLLHRQGHLGLKNCRYIPAFAAVKKAAEINPTFVGVHFSFTKNGNKSSIVCEAFSEYSSTVYFSDANIKNHKKSVYET
jgi:hypothetical protein